MHSTSLTSNSLPEDILRFSNAFLVGYVFQIFVCSTSIPFPILFIFLFIFRDHRFEIGDIKGNGFKKIVRCKNKL